MIYATAIFVLALLACEARGSRLGRWITKPLASLGFVLAGLGAPLPIFVALVLSSIGDVLLIPKSKRAFLAGVGAFLLAHVAYAVAFALHGLTLIAAIAAVPIGAIAAAVARILMPKVEPAMKLPIAIYIVVVSAMFALGVGTREPAWAIAAGMFWLSDLSVARDKFLAPGFVNRAWGLPLYYAAQLVFALTRG